MKVTRSSYQGRCWSISGHLKPSEALLKTVEDAVRKTGEGLTIDHYATFMVDALDQPCGDQGRTKASENARTIREQSFSRSVVLPYSDLEYEGIKTRLDALESRFVVCNPEE